MALHHTRRHATWIERNDINETIPVVCHHSMAGISIKRDVAAALPAHIKPTEFTQLSCGRVDVVRSQVAAAVDALRQYVKHVEAGVIPAPQQAAAQNRRQG